MRPLVSDAARPDVSPPPSVSAYRVRSPRADVSVPGIATPAPTVTHGRSGDRDTVTFAEFAGFAKIDEHRLAGGRA
jgi:hypothetical protein